MAEKRKDASSSWKEEGRGITIAVRPWRPVPHSAPTHWDWGAPAGPAIRDPLSPDPERKRRARGAGDHLRPRAPARPGPAPEQPAPARPPRENRKRAVPARAPPADRQKGPRAGERTNGRTDGRAGGVGWGREAGSDESKTPLSRQPRPSRPSPAPQRPHWAPGRRKSLSKVAPPLTKENEELNGRRGPGDGLEPRTHAPFIEDQTTWGGGSGDGSVGLTTDPGSGR